MKKLFYLASILMLLFSCDCDDIPQVEESVIIEKQISYDTQDDVIKIDGHWLDNSNADWNNWQYEQNIGCRINEGFLWVEVDPNIYEIVDMQLVDFPIVWYASSIDSYSWYFEGPGIIQYIRNYSEVVHIKIKLRKK